MNKKAKTEMVVLLIISAIAIVALVFLFKTMKASGQAAIPIPFADWQCSCRGWCELPVPAYGSNVLSSALRPTVAEAQQACISGLELQCEGFLSYSQMIKCEQYQVQAATT